MPWPASPAQPFSPLLLDLVFYAGVVVAGANVVRALGWPQVLVGNLLAGLSMFGDLQATAPAGTPSWRNPPGHSRIAREGLIAGLLAAAAVAVWFLVMTSHRAGLGAAAERDLAPAATSPASGDRRGRRRLTISSAPHRAGGPH